MTRMLIALVLLGLAVTTQRANAFGGRAIYYGTPVFVAPVYYFGPFVYDFVVYPACPTPCCPAPVAVPATPTAPSQPPKVQVVPSTMAPEKPSKPSVSAAPAEEPSKDVRPAGVAVPRAADPTAPAKDKVILPPTPPINLGPPVGIGEPLQRPRSAETPDAIKPVVQKLDSPAVPTPDTPKIQSPNVPTDPDAFRNAPLRLPLPGEGISESRSSPLGKEKRLPRVDVITVSGSVAVGDPLRTVGFHNRTDREVSLTVQGETVRLPGWHSVTARVPSGFTWKLDDEKPRTTDVPANSPGVEVVIRK